MTAHERLTRMFQLLATAFDTVESITLEGESKDNLIAVLKDGAKTIKGFGAIHYEQERQISNLRYMLDNHGFELTEKGRSAARQVSSPPQHADTDSSSVAE